MTSIFTCCFFKKYQKNAPKDPITWEQTKPFVPPIVSGEVIRVYDGDTITIAAKLPYAASPLYRFQVRLLDNSDTNNVMNEPRNASNGRQSNNNSNSASSNSNNRRQIGSINILHNTTHKYK